MILNILTVLGVISMVIGVLLALFQWDYKRMLAYSSISQVGYIILSISLGTPLGIIGGLFHLINHSVFKTLMFLTSGSVDYATGLRDMRKMGGLKEKMPVTAAASFIGSMSISGVPPFCGFWSKLIIILACIQAGKLWLGLTAALVSILTLSTFLKIQKYVFGGKLNPELSQVKEVPFWMKLPMVILSVLCVLLGAIALPGVSRHFLSPAASALYNGLEYSNNILGSSQPITPVTVVKATPVPELKAHAVAVKQSQEARKTSFSVAPGSGTIKNKISLSSYTVEVDSHNYRINRK